MMAQSEVNSSGMPSPVYHGDSETNTSSNVNNQKSSDNAFPNLGRQSSIYSLTLDEFQHTLNENGKNFGSMNMDEFLSSIWSAEENQAHHVTPNVGSTATPVPNIAVSAACNAPGLARQGSLTLPAPLCRKTVDEVWTEIQRTQRQEQQVNQQHAATTNVNSDAKHQRQPTFGEMTLEDFLVKAGVVREPCVQPPPPPLSSVVPQQHHSAYGFTNSHTQLGPSFVTQPMMGITPGAYGDDSCSFAANGKRGNNGFSASTVAGYGGRVTNAGPPSPMSPDGMCGAGQVDNSAAQYGLDMAAVLRGRKRIIDGPVEKVVERRQRRMIKNRESAARSRARKQAYTVELEAELNQLREENTQLKQALVEIERQKKQKVNQKEQQKHLQERRLERGLRKLEALRRSRSCRL